MGRKKRAGSALRYPITMRIDGKTDYLSINVVEYKPPGLRTGSGNFVQSTSTGEIRRGRNIKQSIILPMPVGLSDTNAVAWDEDSANALELAGAEAFQDLVKAAKLDSGNFQAVVDRVTTQGKASLEKFTAGLDQNTRENILRYFGAKAVGVFGSTISPQSLVTRASGQVLNPNMELLFKGVALRSFPFSFTFTPRSRDESQVIKAIIRTFKTSMAAKTTVAGSTGGRGIFIQSPDVFELEFRRGNKKHPFLFTMKPMALKNMGVNYSDTGAYTTYEDSTPVKMTMSLSFTELNPVYHEDYQDSESSKGVGY
jgi:hypothetical protein